MLLIAYCWLKFVLFKGSSYSKLPNFYYLFPTCSIAFQGVEYITTERKDKMPAFNWHVNCPFFNCHFPMWRTISTTRDKNYQIFKWILQQPPLQEAEVLVKENTNNVQGHLPRMYYSFLIKWWPSGNTLATSLFLIHKNDFDQFSKFWLAVVDSLLHSEVLIARIPL